MEFDEEVWETLRCLGDAYVAESERQLRADRAPLRHIAFGNNLHYRRIRRFAGEPLCLARPGRGAGLRQVKADPTCPKCLGIARRVTEVPLPSRFLSQGQQLSLFGAELALY